MPDESLSHICFSATPWTVAHQTPLFARILEWVAISSSRVSSWLRDRTWVSFVSGIDSWMLYHWATWESLPMVDYSLKKKSKDCKGCINHLSHSLFCNTYRPWGFNSWIPCYGHLHLSDTVNLSFASYSQSSLFMGTLHY